ncbi:MAG: hypothetical protein ACHRXM_25935 [Isosphaerales bacterium]
MRLPLRDYRLSITAVVAGLLTIASTGLAIWAVRARDEANRATEDLKTARAAAMHEREAARLAAVNEQRANSNEDKAKTQVTLADSRRIAALSESQRDKHLDRALILAVEAIHPSHPIPVRNRQRSPSRVRSNWVICDQLPRHHAERAGAALRDAGCDRPENTAGS